MMSILFAQDIQESLWTAILRTVDHNGVWIFVGFCVLAGTAKHLVHRVLKHNERIAMIQAGMHPDDSENDYPKRHAG